MTLEFAVAPTGSLNFVSLCLAYLPFQKVNNSIAMAQLNFILIYKGLRGIEHGELDLSISRMGLKPSFKRYFPNFVDAFLSEHPELEYLRDEILNASDGSNCSTALLRAG